jgi:N-acyl-D-aspartate/D-glutamate deacylase
MLMSKRPAELYGLYDRGVVEVGRRADLNVIDLERLCLKMPELVDDLPGQPERLLQDVDGYVATIVKGEVTYRDGERTAAIPGRLVRGKGKAA